MQSQPTDRAEAGENPPQANGLTTILTAMQPVPEIRRHRRLHYMYGAVTQIELNNLLEGNSIDTEDRKRQIKTAWRTAAARFQMIVATEQDAAEGISTRPLPPEAGGFVAELHTNPAFQESFANYPMTFEEVEIDNIIASADSKSGLH